MNERFGFQLEYKFKWFTNIQLCADLYSIRIIFLTFKESISNATPVLSTTPFRATFLVVNFHTFSKVIKLTLQTFYCQVFNLDIPYCFNAKLLQCFLQFLVKGVSFLGMGESLCMDRRKRKLSLLVRARVKDTFIVAVHAAYIDQRQCSIIGTYV